MDLGKKTCLYDLHHKAGAKLVDFSGWQMPLHYGSQIDEHHFVRKDCGMFDVSHMVAVDIQGVGAKDFLRYLLANDVSKCQSFGKALYSCMLNEKGGVIDDLIVYHLGVDAYRLVVNAGTADNDLAWMVHHQKSFQVSITRRSDLAIIAVQGPNARTKTIEVLSQLLPKSLDEHLRGGLSQLRPFNCVVIQDYFIASTGYTGEDGFEILLPTTIAHELWLALEQAGVRPIGLGARDTLRLEAGYNLYGQDMDETTTPLETNLAWTVSLDGERNFIGKDALVLQKSAGVPRQLVGLLLEPGKGILRHGYVVTIAGVGQGVITSGGFSPTLERSIAMALIPSTQATHALVEIRKNQVETQIVKPAFVRAGKALVD